MKTRKPRIKIKARSLCGRLRGVARAAAERAAQEGQDPALAKHAAVIRELSKRVMKDIIEIGRRLTEAKELVGHGNWAGWLKTEFDWSAGTALNFMHVFTFAEDYKSKKFTDLNIADLNIAPSAMYALARPSMPDEVRDDMMERAGAGEAITNTKVKEALATHAAAGEAISTDETPPPPPPAADEAITTDETPPPTAADESPPPEEISENTWLGRRLIVANKAAGDAWLEDWTQFELDAVVMDAVRATAEAWRKLVEYLEQRRTLH
jgi:Protein of unknown function (DUF3102)